jgi:hypothetical protein
LTASVVRGLRARGIDVLTAEEAGRQRLSDEEQLSFATQDERCLYTANYGDFARLHAEWMRAGRRHAGIVARTQQVTPVGEQIRALAAVCSTYEAGSENLFAYLSEWLERR